MGVGMMAWLVTIAAWSTSDGGSITVRVPLNATSEVDVWEVVARLAEASHLPVDRPTAPLKLPLDGRAASLTMAWLGDTLGPDATLEIKAGGLAISLDPRLSEPDRKPAWERRIRDLATRATRKSSVASAMDSAPGPPIVPMTGRGRRSA